jgi:hypothetical protein
VQLPAYFLRRPGMPTDTATRNDFERLYHEQVAPGGGGEIAYSLTAPKWQFLCYLCEMRDLLLHGSGQPDIAVFEPRQSNDILEFGNRRAVYAASDGIWPIYFAIMDRDRYVTSLANACFRIVATAAGDRDEPYYFFSINGDALPHRPWRRGTIYLLPRGSFEQMPLQSARGVQVEVAQWASPAPVLPLARLTVEPEDFPFLAQILPHDPTVMRERAAANPEGFPWMEE